MNFSDYSEPGKVTVTASENSIWISDSQDNRDLMMGALRDAKKELGAVLKDCECKLQPPDMDDSGWYFEVKLPSGLDTDATLSRLSWIRQTVERSVSDIGLEIEPDELHHTPWSYHYGRASFALHPQRRLIDRVRQRYFSESYNRLQTAALTARDDGHLADVAANTEDPSPARLAASLMRDLKEIVANCAPLVEAWTPRQETNTLAQAMGCPVEQREIRPGEDAAGLAISLRRIANNLDYLANVDGLND